jgi:hypothetical protein
MLKISKVKILALVGKVNFIRNSIDENGERFITEKTKAPYGAFVFSNRVYLLSWFLFP